MKATNLSHILSLDYATAAMLGGFKNLSPAGTFATLALNLLSAVVFPVKVECVDYGSHKHLPDSTETMAKSQSRIYVSPADT